MQGGLNNIYMQLNQYFLSITLSNVKAVYIEECIATINCTWISVFGSCISLQAILYLFLLRCHAEMHR